MPALKYIDENGNVAYLSRGKDGVDGVNGKDGIDGKDGKDYVLTASDKAEIAETVENATFVQAPKFVSSVEEMVDPDRPYVLISTGRIWANAETTVIGTKKEACDDGYTYPEDSRLGSDGTVQVSGSYAGFTVTPFIDILKYPVPFTLHLEGAKFFTPTVVSYLRVYTYTEAEAKFGGGSIIQTEYDSILNISDSDVKINADGSGTITFNKTPTAKDGSAIRYLRFSPQLINGSSPSVYVTYEATTTGVQWFDTGMVYAPSLTAEDKAEIAEDVAEMVDAQLLSLVGDGVVTL